MRQMAVNLAGVELKNPVMTASGTFGSGAEYGEMGDQGCGKCAVARQSDPAYCGGVRRHDQRDRLTESGV